MAFVYKAVAAAVLALALASRAACSEPGGFSYNRFSGPVSGRIVEVQVPAGPGPAQQHASYGYNHQTGQIDPETAKYAHLKTVDYVAKPDYTYAYGVEDPRSGNLQSHREARDGDVVRGEYSLLEPDGSVRLVRYTADPTNGFQAVVHKKSSSGHAHAPQHFGHQKDDRGDHRDREY